MSFLTYHIDLAAFSAQVAMFLNGKDLTKQTLEELFSTFDSAMRSIFKTDMMELLLKYFVGLDSHIHMRLEEIYSSFVDQASACNTAYFVNRFLLDKYW
jgi:hypothetical protein